MTDLPGVDELRSAGLLRKGQVLGALMDHSSQTHEIDTEEVYRDEGFLNEGLKGDEDASV